MQGLFIKLKQNCFNLLYYYKKNKRVLYSDFIDLVVMYYKLL